MKLKSFGCSFIFGNELADDGYGLPKATPSRNTWPALLSAHLEYEYQCHARPGSGNLQILSRLIDSIADSEPSLYVIGWTWIDRFDYCDPANDRWQTITPMFETEQAKFYYRQFHSEYRDKFSTLNIIKSAIDILHQNNHKFIMTYMDDLIYDDKWHTTPGVKFMQDFIKPFLNNFQGKNFLDWSDEKGFPIGKVGKHPLEEAHRAAANLIIADLDQWIKT